MKYLIGFLAGIGTAWAALAIWQRVPPFPDIEPDPEVWRGIHHRDCNWPKRPCLCDLMP